jgi:hypothetical protein
MLVYRDPIPCGAVQEGSPPRQPSCLPAARGTQTSKFTDLSESPDRNRTFEGWPARHIPNQDRLAYDCWKMSGLEELDARHTCGFMTRSGMLCRRTVAGSGNYCWQHASGVRAKFHALTRNQTVGFFLGAGGLLIGLFGAALSYIGLHPNHHTISGELRQPIASLEQLITRDYVTAEVGHVSYDIRIDPNKITAWDADSIRSDAQDDARTIQSCLADAHYQGDQSFCVSVYSRYVSEIRDEFHNRAIEISLLNQLAEELESHPTPQLLSASIGVLRSIADQLTTISRQKHSGDLK